VLLANYSVLNRNCYAMKANAFTNPLALFKATLFPGFYCGDAEIVGETEKSAFNNGYAIEERGGSAWHLSPKAGGLSTSGNVTGTGTLTANLLMGKALEAALSGSGTLSSATLSLIVQLAAALTGSGTISAATLQAIAGLSAALSGSGSISAAALSLIVSLEADLSGSGGATGNLKGTLSMAADITVTGTGLTTSNVGQAVWSALAAANNDPDTMGELLNNSGAGGNPWTVALEGSYTAADLMRIMSAVLAGKTSGQITAPIFRSVDDTEDRVTASVDVDGNRTSVTINP
jgi:hypothetical protein